MKISVFALHIMFIVCFVVISTSCKGAQVKQQEGPHITFESTEVDLGTIRQNGEFEFSFRFTNDGTAVLEILSTKASCGCTIIEEGAQTLHPGESSIITGKFHSRQYKGLLVRTIAVKTNDPANERVVLYIKASIEE